MWSRRRTVAWLCVAVLAGCTGSNPSDGPEGGVSETPAPTEVPTEAGDLRVELEGLFGLHGHLTADAVRATKGARDAAVAAAEDSAEALADALAGAVAPDGGTDSAASAASADDDLADAWSAVTGALVEIRTDGLASSADAAVDDAVAATLAVVGEGPDEEGLEDLLRAPLETLVRHAQAVEGQEREEAYELARDAYAQMVTAGGALAAGITEADPDTYPGPRNSGALELRSALRQLLGSTHC